jgi:hypothetical protein
MKSAAEFQKWSPLKVLKEFVIAVGATTLQVLRLEGEVSTDLMRKAIAAIGMRQQLPRELQMEFVSTGGWKNTRQGILSRKRDFQHLQN